MLPNGKKLWFELQWRPVAGRWIRPDQEPSVDELMDRSVPIHGTTVRLLAPEDNLLQVALHTAKHTYVRAPGFRLHTDVDRIVHTQRIDWDVFLSRVRRLNVATVVYFSLAIPVAIFNTAIPDRVLDQLRPPPWKETVMLRWINQSGLFNPFQKKFGKLRYIAFTALLYDDTRGLRRGIFPDAGWMRERYGFKSGIILPFYYAKRIANLTFRRVGV